MEAWWCGGRSSRHSGSNNGPSAGLGPYQVVPAGLRLWPMGQHARALALGHSSALSCSLQEVRSSQGRESVPCCALTLGLQHKLYRY